MSYFHPDELRCKCGCGTYVFDKTFLELLNLMREESGFAWPISSGYRCPDHPIEAAKSAPGVHTEGIAVDVAVYGAKALMVTHIAMNRGVSRIGWKQHGPYDERFVHLDMSVSPDVPHPWVWTYR